MGTSIKFCKESDIEFLVGIIDEQLDETNQKGDKELIFKNLKSFVKNPTYNLVLLTTPNLTPFPTIIGGTIVKINRPFWRNVNYGSISWFFIRKKYRNFRNAKKLLTASEKWLEDRNVQWIESDVWHVDQRGQINKFYVERYKTFLEKINKYELCGYRLRKNGRK